ncbi:UNVERIFIED_CONTAM: hypothetical protein HDU68_002444 [Siphonaria sp. JEL0065]|nr:hypothetical protein HDU68_002444 [Siphonaria sp. JEL0065]
MPSVASVPHLTAASFQHVIDISSASASKKKKQQEQEEATPNQDFIAFLVWRIMICPAKTSVPSLDLNTPLPWSSITVWVRKLIPEQDVIPVETISLALLFLKRFCPDQDHNKTKEYACTEPPMRFSNFHIKKCFITSLVLSMKVLDDDCSGTKGWAQYCKEQGVVGINRGDLNSMERQMLSKLEFNLFITPAQFEEWDSLLFETIYREYFEYMAVRAETEANELVTLF